ncbi:MAG: HipA domain-containing protein [Bdellovibrionales bacterium]|nr:HipA domain-containing protein [Bdellovibrionales bacterium]
MTVFSYLIANGNMHAKNVSVIAKDGRVVLTPAYDLVSTLPYGDQTMALKLEGRKTKLRVKDFVAWGKRGGLREAAIESTIRRVTDKIAPAIDELERIGLDEKKTDFLRRSIRERLDGLGLYGREGQRCFARTREVFGTVLKRRACC